MKDIEIDTIIDRFALIELCEPSGYVLYLPFDTCHPYILHEELSNMAGIGSEHYHHLAYEALPREIDALAFKKMVQEWDFSEILQGSSITMDGNNQVGHLTPEAQEAVEDFFFTVSQCQSADFINYHDDTMDMDDAVRLGLTAVTTDAELKKIANRHYDEIEERGAYLIGSVEGELIQRREEMREQREEEASD